MSSYTTAIDSITACLAHAPKKCTQSGIFQFDINATILSTRKLKTLCQNYKLELTTGIACIDHAFVNIREFNRAYGKAGIRNPEPEPETETEPEPELKLRSG